MSTTRQPPEGFAVAKSGWWKGMHPGMAMASLAMVAAFVIFTVVNVEGAARVYSSVRSWIESSMGWLYIVSICIVFLACLYVMCSRHGKVRLGDDDARPEFSTFSWLAMLFSAGSASAYCSSRFPSRCSTSTTPNPSATPTIPMRTVSVHGN